MVIEEVITEDYSTALQIVPSDKIQVDIELLDDCVTRALGHRYQPGKKQK